ncbi:MAG: excinuclease ABC subunit UvrC [Thermoproteota archaeon]|nr:excinuclease ABC subunit UvrC [Thermoproteota archaeon]
MAYQQKSITIKEKARSFPSEPGVYLMKNKEGKIIYIGKSKNLKKRIFSYFGKNQGITEWKTSRLLRNVFDIDFMITDNEIEAFLLESNLIKQYRPVYNIELKDQQRYTYLKISEEEFPRLLVTRRNREGKFKGPPGKIFGPFVQGSSRYLTVGFLRKIFKIRICNRLPKKPCLEYFIKNCDAPCMDNVTQGEYMKNVTALSDILSEKRSLDNFMAELRTDMSRASTGLQYEKAREIRNTIIRLENLRSRQKMESVARSASSEEFVGILPDVIQAKAHVMILRRHHGVIRDRKKYEFDIVADNSLSTFLLQYYSGVPSIPHIIYVTDDPDSKVPLEESLTKIASHRVEIIRISKKSGSERIQIMDLIVRNLSTYVQRGCEPALTELKEMLLLDRIPKIIDCFDVSNLGSSIAVGSCVRYSNGIPDKSQYRRFRIRTVKGQNDFAMISEIVTRRYRTQGGNTRESCGGRKGEDNDVNESENYPDMILIDGGRGQLNSAKSALDKLKNTSNISCISIAKENEEIYADSLQESINLPKRSEALKILQSLRDEAHRFGLAYNIKLRNQRQDIIQNRYSFKEN